jgi:DNA mismatch repair protein MutS
VNTTYPPLIQSFIDIQMKYPDFIVLTEVGGFFEIWQLDELGIGHAERASHILDIVLTRRDKSKLESPRMAGFPSYSVENYIKKLVAAGETVVLVRQEITGKKSDNNKNVKRFVERIISPGTEITTASEEKTNYFASVYKDESNIGISIIDLSTGTVSVSEMSEENAIIYLNTLDPVEVLFNSEPIITRKDRQVFHSLKKPISKMSSAGLILSKIYEIENPTSNHSVTLTQLGLELYPLGSLAIANLLNYLTEYNELLLKKIAKPKILEFEKSLFLSKNAFMSLDILPSAMQAEASKTLYGILNRCKTAMGRRILKEWIRHPLTDFDKITTRQDQVANLVMKNSYYDELSEVFDIAKGLRRIAIHSTLPHELPSFYNSLVISSKTLSDWQSIDKVSEAIEFLNSNIDFEVLISSPNNFYRSFRGGLKSEISSIENEWLISNDKLSSQTERISTVLETKKLRISSKEESSQLLGPKGLALKCERENIQFKLKASDIQITDDLWEKASHEEFSLKSSLDSKANELYILFQDEFIDKFGTILLEFSEVIGEKDVISTFAKISVERNYVVQRSLKMTSLK